MTPAPLPCARTVTAGHHDAALLAWQADGVSNVEIAGRLHCSATTICERLATLRRAAGGPKRKPHPRTMGIQPDRAALSRLTPKLRAAWNAWQADISGRTLAKRLDCHPVTARNRLFRARRVIAAGASA